MSTVESSFSAQFIGRSYVYTYRQAFQHLTRAEYPLRNPDVKTRLSLKSIAHTYINRIQRRSMVKSDKELYPKKSTQRSAGQASSPQNIATRTIPIAPASRRASPSLDKHRNNEQLQARRVSHGHAEARSRRDCSRDEKLLTSRTSPEPAEDTESVGSTSDGDTSDFSSRATSPETEFSVYESVVQRKKREIVNDSMNLFKRLLLTWFTQQFGIVVHAGSGSRATKGSRGSGGNDEKKPLRAGGQKRHLDDDDDEDGGVGGNNEGGGDGEDRKRTRPNDDKKLKFACPYAKHNPAKYGKVRTCCGPGWDDIHRVKEHLYRRHRKPKFFCHRCSTVFKTDDSFQAHQRQIVPCPFREHNPPDGFDQEQEDQLKTRHKGGSQQSERHKWEDTYQILFPDDLIPSPYYDEVDARPNGFRRVPEDVSSLAQYITRELVPQFRREVEREVNKDFNDVGEKMKNRTLSLVQDAMTRVVRVWEHSQNRRRSLSVRSSPGPDSGFATPEPSIKTLAPVPDPGSAIPDGTAILTNELPLDLEGEDYLEELLKVGFDDDGFGSLVNFDSAYGTGAFGEGSSLETYA